MTQPPLTGARKGTLAHALAFAVYALITMAWFWRVLPVIGQAYAHDAGDPALNAWILDWNSRVVPFTTAWWNAPAFYPLAGVATFTELLVGVNLIASPVLWLWHNPVLAYNVAFFLSFPLSAFAAYLLALELTGDRRAAFLAGMAFAFAPYRVAQVPHLQVLASYGMPLALYGLHRYLRDRRARWLVLFALAWLVQAFSNGYYLLFFTVFLGLWAAWFMSRRAEWRALPRAFLAWFLVALPVVPVMLKYREVHEAFGMVRQLREIVFFSGDLSSFITASPDIWLWGWLRHFAKPEGELFPGVTIVVLIVLGVVAAYRQSEHRGGIRRVRLALALGAVTGALVAVSFLVFGSWRIGFGSFTLLSVGRFHKPFTVFLVCTVAFALSHPRFIEAFRRRSAFAFYVLASMIVGLASLGPEPRVMGERFFYKPPYAFLLELPGFYGLRVPTRFWGLAILCLAIAGALAFTRLGGFRRRMTPRWATILMVIFAAGIALDAWPIERADPAAPLIACQADGGAKPVAFLQLPIGTVFGDISAITRALDRRLPAVNGYSGYAPPHYFALQYGLTNRDVEVLQQLAALGPLEVAVDARFDEGGRQGRFIERQPGVVELRNCGPQLRVFRLPAATGQNTGPIATAQIPQAGSNGTRDKGLRIAALKADFAPEFLRGLTDGDLTTRWETPQKQDRTVLVDLGSPRALQSLTLLLGPFTMDFPRALRIEHSPDGAAWQTAFEGTTYRQALWGAFKEPKRYPLDFPLPGVTARYLRLTQYGRDPIYSWSIAEIIVH